MPPTENLNFLKPPVSEVMLSAQFVQVDGFTAAHFGLLWNEFRKQFPAVEQHGPVPHTVEAFGQMIPLMQGMSFPLQIIKELPSPRIWFKSNDGAQIIQLQSDRLMHNWRKISPEDQYPRYKKMRELFGEELDKFETFLRSEGLGRLVPDQCEITYINHIPSSEGFEDLANILSIWNRPNKEKLPLEIEDVQIRQQYIIPDADKKPIGRVYIDARSAAQPLDPHKVFLVSLTARTKPIGEGIEAVLQGLDMGRKWIADAFVAITTPEIRKLWGEQYDA